MNFRTAVLTVALGVAMTGAASAQVISYSPRTGDISIDSQLGYMNDYGRSNRDYFIDDVVSNFGAPRYLVNDLMTTRHWSAGDVYYACALAYEAHRPCSDAVRYYEQDRGQGWGAVAQRMGIKPGSAEFHALKGRVGKSNGKYRAYRGGHHDAPDSHDGHDGHGDSGEHQARHYDTRHYDTAKPKGNKHDNGDHGNSGKGNGKSSGKGKGKSGGH